jgi:hypothetical protein
MLRNKLFSLTLVAAALALPVQLVFASAIPDIPKSFVKEAKGKLVKFSVRNTTSAPLDLQCGDKIVTIAAGQLMEVKLPVGTKVVTSTATTHNASGTVILEVSSAYKDTIVSIS